MIIDIKEQRLFKLQYNLLKLPEFRIYDGHKVYWYEDWVGFRENGSESIIT